MPHNAQTLRPPVAGPSLAVILSAVLVGVCGVLYWHGGGSLESVRLIDRLTARLAVVLFSLGFAASDLMLLVPSGPTRWLLAHRRNLMIAFAIMFALHLCAIAGFYRLDAALFWSVSPPALIVLRGIGVAFIVLMLITSMSGGLAPGWKQLNAFGGYYVWGAFLTGFAKRAPLDSFYLLPVALLALVLVVKLAASWRRGASQRPAMNL
jgi:hypothetical protein